MKDEGGARKAQRYVFPRKKRPKWKISPSMIFGVLVT